MGEELSFGRVFADALRGEPCAVEWLGDEPTPLPVDSWRCDASAADDVLVGLCRGATLDIGCGPGRLAQALCAAGHQVLGIDVVDEAIEQTRARGVPAVRGDVFAAVRGEGSWNTVLLADGNIGIGGDPERLLRRAVELLAPGGRVVVEVAPPGTETQQTMARLVTRSGHSKPFAWAVVSVDHVGEIAGRVGLSVAEKIDWDGRWAVALT